LSAYAFPEQGAGWRPIIVPLPTPKMSRSGTKPRPGWMHESSQGPLRDLAERPRGRNAIVFVSRIQHQFILPSTEVSWQSQHTSHGFVLWSMKCKTTLLLLQHMNLDSNQNLSSSDRTLRKRRWSGALTVGPLDEDSPVFGLQLLQIAVGSRHFDLLRHGTGCTRMQ